MSMRGWDRGAGLAFAAIGLALAAAALRLPPGLAGIPGPGFFPLLIGVALAALGAGLALSAGPADASYWTGGSGAGQAAGMLALLAVYVALWDLVPFLVRTPLLLVAVYRLAGEPWRRSILISAAATLALAGVFDTLLRVRL